MAKPFDLDAIASVPSPCFILDEAALANNMATLRRVMDESGCSVIAALKAFSMWPAFAQISQTLPGSTASSLNEVRLAHEEFGGEIHAYAPAYVKSDLQAMLPLVSHITFNSFSQWERYKDLVQLYSNPISCGIRVNPEWSSARVPMYDAAAPFSRMGVTRAEFRPDLLDGIEGLHLHCLDSAGPAQLAQLIAAFEEKFGEFLPRMKWVNFGGGHHITRQGYDVDHLIEVLIAFRAKWGVEVILEPGEAVCWEAGVLVATVLDLVHNGMDIAVLDASASAHMPDCIELPYQPAISGAALSGVKAHTFRLGSVTCLSGDILGDYSFDQPLAVGDRLVIEDMMQYTMVKSSFFNGVRHPAIAIRRMDGTIEVLREFGYEDFKGRLG